MNQSALALVARALLLLAEKVWFARITFEDD